MPDQYRHFRTLPKEVLAAKLRYLIHRASQPCSDIDELRSAIITVGWYGTDPRRSDDLKAFESSLGFSIRTYFNEQDEINEPNRPL